MSNEHDEDDIFTLRRIPTRGRRRLHLKAHARRTLGGPIQQKILELVHDNPEMGYNDVATHVRKAISHARTTEKSVASTVYRLSHLL